MNKTVVLYLRALLALAALIGFMYLYGRAIIESGAAAAPVYTDAYIYVATALAGLVGGVAATGLGQSLDNRLRGRTFFMYLGKVLAPFQAENLQNTLAIVYTVVYIIYGIAAIIAWVAAPADSAVVEMVRNLALIFIGLALATAQNFFGIESNRYPAAKAGMRQPAAKTGEGKNKRHK